MPCTIDCIWGKQNQYLINPDGQVFPCCYLSNVYYYSHQMKDQNKWEELYEGHKHEIAHHLLDEYKRLEKENNIMETPIDDIINGEWFSEILPKSWENEETIHIQCKRLCSNSDATAIE